MAQFIKRNFEKILVAISFFAVIFIYLVRLPYTVQGSGDSGELVYSAHSLIVPHPPGYPLWVWLGHLWLKMGIGGTVYFQLALMNCILGVLTLVALYKYSKNKLLGVSAVLFLAVDSHFWRYVEMPEVFTLNTFLLAMIIVCAGSTRVFEIFKFKVKLSNFVPVLFFLGALNHLTIIFIVPVVLWLAWQSRKDIWWYISSVLGLIIFFGGYWSLMLLNVDHIYSWGQLSSIGAVWNHFLRKDFGTFSLGVMPMSAQVRWLVYEFYVNHLAKNCLLFVLLMTLILFFVKEAKGFFKRITGEQWALLVSIVFYILFFVARANVAPVGFGEDIQVRFTIMLSVMIFFWFQRLIPRENVGQFLSAFVITLSLGYFSFKIISEGREHDLSGNTIIEDYALNLLRVAENQKAKIMVVTGDSEYYAVRYAQLVLQKYPEAIVMNIYSLVGQSLADKIEKLLPDLKIQKHKQYNVENELFLPNVDKYNFLVTRGFNEDRHLKISFFSLGRLISKGEGTEIGDIKEVIPSFRSGLDVIATPAEKFDPARDLFAQYAYYFLAQGLQQYKLDQLNQAVTSFEKALEIVPYCAPALENLCKIKEQQKITDLRCVPTSEVGRYYPYFLQSSM